MDTRFGCALNGPSVFFFDSNTTHMTSITRKSHSFSLICRILLGLFVALSSTITHAAVGRIAGDFAVDSGGNATYRIPIAVAEAANGMQPSIALTYNSRSRDGLAGIGWNLAGFSKIERCGLSIALDTKRQGVTYTDEDRFCLDGQPLIKISSGAYGGNSVEYRAQVHDYQKVTSHKTVGTGPKYFKAAAPRRVARSAGVPAAPFS